LEICIKLLDDDLILKDATPWNIVFESSKPVFVDFTSIMPVDTDLNWVALDQYLRLFLFPLLAAENGFGTAVRSLLLASQTGISLSEIGRFLRKNNLIKKSWLVNRLFVPRAMVNLLQNSGQDKELGKLISKTTIPEEKRKQFFLKLLAELDSIKLLKNQKRWSQYQADMASYFDAEKFNPKQEKISSLLQELKPRSVVCIGCKKGGFAILAARQGISVTAFDTNEESLDMLYQSAKFNDLKILPLVMDIANPTPSAGWRASQYPSAIERLRAEGALALTQVHNLAITQGHSFNKIAEVYSDLCEKWLITEFLPIEDPRVKELLLTFRRDLSWYSLEGFIEALGMKFKNISTFESYPSGRTLILCKK
jgi:SAM-dependent methyltransferase